MVASTAWKAPCFPDEHRNVEAGPPTLMLPPTSYIGLPTLQPPRGISETTADAEQNETSAEEDKVPVSNIYRPCIHRVPELLFDVRRLGGLSSPVAKYHPVPTA